MHPLLARGAALPGDRAGVEVSELTRSRKALPDCIVPPAIGLHKSRLMRYRLASGEDWRCSVRPITDLTGRTERSGHVHLDLARSELDSLWNSDREQAVLEGNAKWLLSPRSSHCRLRAGSVTGRF